MLKTVEKVLLLQDVDIFKLATTEHLAHLAGVSQETYFEPEQQIFSRGETASRLHIVVEGQVRLDNGKGDSEIVERSGLDFLSVFSEAPHVSSAETVTPCTLLVVSFDDLVDLLTTEAGFCWAILRFLGRFGLERLGGEE